jgi:hypothetical protein
MTNPYFTDGTNSFSNLVIPLNSVKTFTIPPYKDWDNDVVSVLIQDAKTSTSLTWAYTSGGSFVIAPTSFDDVKSFDMQIVLSTIHEQIKFPFTVEVTNSAPYFLSPPKTGFELKLNF